jgi:hypothetical protein
MKPEIRPHQDEASPSQCTATTGKGIRCRAYAVKGGTLCRGHSMSPEEKTALTAASAASRSKRAEARRDALKSTKQRLAEVVEELQGEIEGAYRDALRTGSPEDLRRAQAAEALLSRVLGRPTQPTEDITPGNPVLDAFASLSPDERRALLRLAQPLPTDPDTASAQG